MNDTEPRDDIHKKRRLSRRWIIAGGAGIIAVAVVVVILLFRSTKPSLLTADKLDSALLGVEQINTIMNTSNMQLDKPASAPAEPTVALSKPNCLGALTAAQATTYHNTDYTGFRFTEARTPGKHIDHYVAQAIAVFPSAEKAETFVQNSADQWNICATKTVIVMQHDKSINSWQIGTVVGNPPNITLSDVRKDVANWKCQRALRAVSNAVIDATACGFAIDDQGKSIADQIAVKIST